MTDQQRNFLILGLIALAVIASQTVAVGVAIFSYLLNIAFTIAILAFLVYLYRSRAGTIAAMPALPRMVLQVASAVLFVVVATGATHLPLPGFGWAWAGGSSSLLFFALLGTSGFAIFWAWGQRSTRW